MKNNWMVSGLCFLIAAVFPVYIASCISRYGVDVLSVDDWHLVDFFNSVAESKATLKDYFSTVNNHVFFFPRIILLPVALFGYWNTKYAMFISYLFALLSVFILVFTFGKLINFSNFNKIALSTLVASGLIFSTAPSENWLISIQLSQFLSSLCFLVILAILTYLPSYQGIALSSIFALISTFSYGFGFISFIAAYPLIASVEYRLRKPSNLDFVLKRIILGRSLIFWTATFFISLCAYILNAAYNINYYNNPDFKGFNRLFWGSNLVKVFDFFMSISGAPLGLGFSSPYQASFWWGLILNITFGACVIIVWLTKKHNNFSQFIPWLSLGLFSISANLITCYARVNLQPNQSLNPRYISGSSFLIIAIIFICLQLDFPAFNATTKKILLLLFTVFTIGACYSYFMSWNSGLAMINHISSIRLQSKACIAFIHDCPDAFLKRTLQPRFVMKDFKTAQKLGMLKLSNLYEEDSENRILYGHFDGIMPLKVRISEIVEVWGWAISPSHDRLGTVVVTKEDSLSKTFLGLESASLPSSDIKDYLKNPDYSHVRWKIRIPAKDIGLGQHILKAWTFDSQSTKLVQIGNSQIVTVQN